MRHLPAIAGREFRSLFVSPVAYAVLTFYAALAGFFFIASVLSFSEQTFALRMAQRFDQLELLNLNEWLIAPYFGVMSIVLMFIIPGVTMGLFSSEKVNGTFELLLTSPLTVWEIVLGKFLAAVGFVAILVAMTGFYVGILFWKGDPEGLKTAAGLLGLAALGIAYAAIGAFASSVTRSQIIAFVLTFAILLVLWMLSFLADLGAGGVAANTSVSAFLRWLSTSVHFEPLVQGLVETRDLAYFAAATAAFLLLAKAVVESLRWR